MTSVSRVLELIGQPESSLLEFKRESTDGIVRELVAFANSDGGTLIVGVDDDRRPVGVDTDGLEERVMNWCADRMDPPQNPVFELIELPAPDEVTVAVVTMARSLSVVAERRGSKRTYWHRVGSTVREMGPDDLGRLFQRRSGVRAEVQPIVGTSVADLDLDRIAEFVALRGSDTPDTSSIDQWERLAFNQEFLVEGGPDGLTMSLAGAVLFARDVGRAVSHSAIEVVAFGEIERSAHVVARQTFRQALVSRSEPREVGQIDAALDFTMAQLATAPELDADSARMVASHRIPREIVREAIVNAVAHRDYLLQGSKVEVFVFPDRLEVSSPGRLINGISPERMRAGARAARNELIRDVLTHYGYAEALGLGVSKHLTLGMREFNGTEADLFEDREGDRFVVTLRFNGLPPE